MLDWLTVVSSETASVVEAASVVATEEEEPGLLFLGGIPFPRF